MLYGKSNIHRYHLVLNSVFLCIRPDASWSLSPAASPVALLLIGLFGTSDITWDWETRNDANTDEQCSTVAVDAGK